MSPYLCRTLSCICDATDTGRSQIGYTLVACRVNFRQTWLHWDTALLFSTSSTLLRQNPRQKS